ncbi:MAG: hypothetical protein ACE5E6_09485 [Phycisphaerae bacterium]
MTCRTWVDMDAGCINPASGDYHIDPLLSPCRDFGDAFRCGMYDFDFEDGVCNGVVDMGADEVCIP